jgi:dTDP-glucose 4,6-dehydratase
VLDHARAIDIVFHKGKNKSTYNIGGFNEWQNIDLIRLLCSIMDKKLNRNEGASEELITFIKDRPGHDKRYAIDASKINKELGWDPSVTFEEGLLKTVEWYLKNPKWIAAVIWGSYKEYYKKQYL